MDTANDNDELSKFIDQEILAKTCWGECRGGGYIGMQSVANVINNRSKSGIKWWGHDTRTICLHSYQFSCWLKSDPNRSKLLAVTDKDPSYKEALSIAAEYISGNLVDITNGATSYYAKNMATPPRWAEDNKPVAEIAGQLFFIV